jgi:hypothetical protein
MSSWRGVTRGELEALLDYVRNNNLSLSVWRWVRVIFNKVWKRRSVTNGEAERNCLQTMKTLLALLLSGYVACMFQKHQYILNYNSNNMNFTGVLKIPLSLVSTSQ